MRILILHILLFCSLSALGQKIPLTPEERVWIEKNPIVYFGYDPNWPPYEIYENGKYTGVCNDFIQLISKRTGIKFMPAKDLTWEKSFQQLKDNQLYMAPGTAITEERLKDLIFTDNYIRLPWVVVTRKDYKKEIDTLSDFNYKKVSIPRDYLQHEILAREFPKIKLVLRDDFAECLHDVSSGYSVATVGSLGTISYFINETSSSDVTIANYTHYQDYSVAFAFPKEQQILRNIVQKGLNSISKSERNKIFAKWTTITLKSEYDKTEIINYILIISGIVLIIILLFYLWNKSLRKQIYLRTQIEEKLSNTLDEVKKQNNDKTILLQEIHHRVKNNLQIIISMLRLQANAQQNPEVKTAFDDAIDRINSISLIHEHIYKSPNLTEFSLKSYIQSLGQELKHVFINNKDISFEIDTADIQLNIKPIVPLALILNELFTNSFKYGFLNKSEGIISIRLFIDNKDLYLVYKDNGEWFENQNSANFGSYLIEIFTEQLDGTFQRIEGESANYEFIFKNIKD